MYRGATLVFAGGLLIIPSLAVSAGGTTDVVKGQSLRLPVSVATVEAVKGQVSVNRGQGFEPVVTTTQVKSGDVVMARPHGQGKILYAGGCMVNVYPGAVVAVKKDQKESCKVAKQKPMTLGPACDPSTDDKCLAAPAVREPVWPWLAGAGLAVGVSCIGWCRCHGSSCD
jgi:hypothetical protein